MTLLHPHPESDFRRAGVEPPRRSPAWAVGRAVMASALAATTVASGWPLLAWVGFVPLLAAARSRSWLAAGSVGVLAGVGVVALEQLLNRATPSPSFAASSISLLLVVCLLARGGWLIWLVPAAWAVGEWLGGVFGTGPAPLGYAHARWPVVCQLADAGGVATVGFLALLVNVTLATARPTPRAVGIRAALLVGGAAVVFGYGALRLRGAATDPGPVVRVGDVTALASPTTAPSTAPAVDLLVVDAGADAPPLNREARTFARGTPRGQAMGALHQAAMSFAYDRVAAVLVAAPYEGAWRRTGDDAVAATDRRRAAYPYDRLGTPAGVRLDPPWPLPDNEQVLSAFKLDAWRIAVALGGEIDSPLRVRGMAGGKRADVIVAFVDDGAVPPSRVLPAATFRAIEHRAAVLLPRQRRWVDAAGRVHAMTGDAAALTTDRRATPYGRWGDAFPTLCALGTIAAVAGALVRRQWFAR